MKGFKKFIELFHDEKYRDLEYGTIYYVAGSGTKELNSFVQGEASAIAAQINSEEDSWLGCNIVYLDVDNSLFAPSQQAMFYTAMLPTEECPEGCSPFFVATLVDCDTELVKRSFTRFYNTLLQLLDEVLDEGTYSEWRISEDEDFTSPARDIRFSIVERRTIDLFVERSYPELEPVVHTGLSKLVITPNQYKLLLSDYDVELRMPAQVKALYVLFLLYPKGIQMRRIGDYKEEYKRLYFAFSNRSDTDKMRASIEQLLDRMKPEALNVKKAQCNRILRNAIPEDDLRKHYEIQAPRWRPHVIKLDRKLVSMPESLLLCSK